MKEKILPCRCHKINSKGEILSKLKQVSIKGKQGFQTILINDWNKLTPILTKSGYYQISIHKRTIRVNRLIAINFLENPFCYPEVHHINDIKTDNRLENLKWGNQKDNAKDRELNGKTAKGIKQGNAKLNELKVKKIRELRKNYSLKFLADKFNVSKKLILLVCQNKIWKHVKK